MAVLLSVGMHTEDVPFWVWSPFAQVRWSTVLTFAVVAAVIAWRRRNPLLGLVGAMSWLAGFEILYQATGAVVHGWSLLTLTYTITGTTGWLIAAAAFGLRIDYRVVAVFAVLWVVWLALGYDSNMPDRIIPGADRVFSGRDEAINVATKTLLAAALVVGSWSRRDRQGGEVRAVGSHGGREAVGGGLELEGVRASGQ